MNFSISSLVLSRVTEKSPLLNKRFSSLDISKSQISKSLATMKIKSQKTFLQNSRFSDFLSTAVSLNSDLEHIAIGMSTRANDKFFVAKGCHFINCKTDESGGAFYNNVDQSVVRFEECHFLNCQSFAEGGSIYSKLGSFYLIDSIFEECHANIGAQCALIHGDKYSILTLTRNIFLDCPSRPPDASGSVVKLILGMQKLSDINISRNEMITGAGGYLAYQPYYHQAKYCVVQDTKATNTIIINNSPHNSTAPSIENSVFVSNNCDMPDVIFATSRTYVKECTISNNVVGEFIDDPLPKNATKEISNAKNNTFRNDDLEKSTPKEEEVRRRHKRVQNYVEFIDCTISSDSRIFREASFTRCKSIGSDSLPQIPVLQKPIYPQVPPRTPITQFHFASGYVLLLCPVFTIIVMLIGLLIQTAKVNDFDADVYV